VVWPIWFSVVADIISLWPILLWPIWFVVDMVAPSHNIYLLTCIPRYFIEVFESRLDKHLNDQPMKLNYKEELRL